MKDCMVMGLLKFCQEYPITCQNLHRFWVISHRTPFSAMDPFTSYLITNLRIKDPPLIMCLYDDIIAFVPNRPTAAASILALTLGEYLSFTGAFISGTESASFQEEQCSPPHRGTQQQPHVESLQSPTSHSRRVPLSHSKAALIES